MDTKHHSRHIPQWKKDEVEHLKNKITSYPVVGIVSMRDIPSKQLQAIRKNLRGVAELKMSRNTFIDRTLDNFEDNMIQLKDYVSTQTAVIFTKKNPFALYKMLEASKSPAPIKGGNIAPSDIIVERGPTSFPPGPIVGDLQNAGIPAAIESGKVVVRETKTVAKEGDKVSNKLATMLSRLEIYPLTIGLDMKAAYENELIFKPEDLAIDEQEYADNLVQAAQFAFNLSVNTAYPTKTTIEAILINAASESRNLAINCEIIMPETIGTLLAKAYSQMVSLSDKMTGKDVNSTAEVAEKPTVSESAEPQTEEKEEEKKEEETAAGLGSLFE